MLLYLLAYLLFLIGSIGVFLNGGIEFWLWFLAFGVVLDCTLVSLLLLGSTRLNIIKNLHWGVNLVHGLYLLFAAIAGLARLRAEMDWFLLFLGISLILWTYFIFKLIDHNQRSN